MKYIKSFFLFGLLVLLGAVSASAMSQSESRSFVLSTLKKYAPDGYNIISSYRAMPTEIKAGSYHMRISKTDFMTYASGSSALALIKSIGTMVHETCHGYQSRKHYQIIKDNELKFDNNGKYITIYAGDGKDYLIKQTPIFRTRKMAASIPPSLRTFRYSYINSTSEYLGAQQDGVYGLLDEMSAYFHDTHTSYLLIKNANEIFANKKFDWNDLLHMALGTYYAHREFKYFILAYLRYAKTNYPSIYSGIMNNRPFLQAFFAIDNKFKKLVKDLFSFSFLKGTSYKVVRGKDMIGIARIGSMRESYTSSFEASYKKLGVEMDKSVYFKLLNDMRENIE